MTLILIIVCWMSNHIINYETPYGSKPLNIIFDKLDVSVKDYIRFNCLGLFYHKK